MRFIFKMATASVQPAEAARIFVGKHAMVKPVAQHLQIV